MVRAEALASLIDMCTTPKITCQVTACKKGQCDPINDVKES
jgi:hypothetical protein